MIETITDIRKRCRRAMNGATSNSMRKYGLYYKLNLGLSIAQIKEIAKHYVPSKQLAEILWSDNTRELKILASLLYPVDQYDETTADIWVSQIPNQEIREQVCINLFQKLPFANSIALRWISSNQDDIKTTGYWLIGRLLLTNNQISLDTESLPYIWGDIICENISLRKAAILVLQKLGRVSKDHACQILDKLSDYRNSTNLLHQEIYNSLQFEFEFYH